MGCFKDEESPGRTLPKYLKNLRPDIDWYNMNKTIEDCAKLAHERKIQYFGIQYYGECWGTMPGKVPDYDKYGPAFNCWSGVGSSWSNYVYKIITG